MLLIACGGNEDKTYITFGEMGVLSAQIETTEAGSLRVPSPAGISVDSCLGWQVKTEDGTIFLPIGATYTYEAGENKSFTPVYFNFTTDDATLLLDDEAAVGICFTTTVKKEEWEKLTAFVAEVTRGTLILSASEAAEIQGKITHAVLEKAGTTAIDVPATDWLTDAAGELCFGGTLTDISELFRSKEYTAVGYVKITHVDGSEAYIYAGSKGYTTPRFSVMSLARTALLDLSDTRSDAYPHPAGDKFSPYTDEEQAKLTELSKFSVLLVSDASVRGNRRLHDDFFTLYTESTIRFGDDSNTSGDSEYSEEAQEIYCALRDNRYVGGGALIMTTKDGTQLSDENIGKISIDYGTIVGEIKTYIFYKGSLVIPYSVYTRPY